MYDFVLPLNVRNKWGHETERVEILRDTFRKYCPDARFILVTPRDQISHWKSVMPEAALVLADEDLMEEECRGWLKQQFMKILAYQHVETDAYWLLDSDIFLTKPIPEGNYRRGGKPVLHLCHSPPNQLAKEGLVGAAKYLEVPDIEDAMHFTPAIFSVEAVKLLISNLEFKLGEDWKKILIWEHHTWTEYSLYLTCLRSHRKTGHFHSWQYKKPCHKFDTLLELRENDIHKAMVLVNSYIGIYPQYIRDALKDRGIL